ncbi:MAG: hypothetical protein WCJ70_01485 [bacterium]
MSRLSQENREIFDALKNANMDWHVKALLHELPAERLIDGQVFSWPSMQKLLQENPYVFTPPGGKQLQPTMEALVPGFTDELALHTIGVLTDPRATKEYLVEAHAVNQAVGSRNNKTSTAEFFYALQRDMFGKHNDAGPKKALLNAACVSERGFGDTLNALDTYLAPNRDSVRFRRQVRQYAGITEFADKSGLLTPLAPMFTAELAALLAYGQAYRNIPPWLSESLPDFQALADVPCPPEMFESEYGPLYNSVISRDTGSQNSFIGRVFEYSKSLPRDLFTPRVQIGDKQSGCKTEGPVPLTIFHAQAMSENDRFNIFNNV